MKGKFSLMWRLVIALVMVLSFSLVMAAPVSAGTLTSVSATPVSSMAGATTTYTIAFTTATTGTIKTVDMTFATGFGVSGATKGTVSVIGAGTVSVSGQTVTYTVTEPQEITKEIAISINLAGIVNPAAGAYSVTVTTKDEYGIPIDEGTKGVTITPLPASFKVVAGDNNSVDAGTKFTVKVTALKSDGVTTEGQYIGAYLINFSSTASEPKTIPAFEVITFASGEGTSTSSFVLNVVETGKKITATDSALGITGTSAAITIKLAGLRYLTITGAPASVTAGVAFTGGITVTAKDDSGNVKTDYVGTVSWSSTDSDAVLPANYTFTSGDAGVHTFLGSSFKLKTAGSQTITVSGSDVSGGASITVNPAAAVSLSVTREPATIAADGTTASKITAKALDAFANVDTNYTGSVTFATSLGTLSSVSTNFVSGVATATLKSTKVGTATIKVTSGTLPYKTTTVTLEAPTKLAEVWVDALNGNNANPGTESSPVKTITHGISIAAEGGTVKVKPGTYNEQVIINVEGLTVQSTAGAATTFIDGTELSPADPTYVALVWLQEDRITFRGFTVQNCPASMNRVIFLQHLPLDKKLTGCLVTENIITKSLADCTGIDMGYVGSVGSDENTISNNIISGSGSTSINVNASLGSLNNVISGNTIINSADYGIMLQTDSWGTQRDLSGTVVSGNEISGGSHGIGVTYGKGTAASPIVIRDNHVHGVTTGTKGDIEGIEVYNSAYVDVVRNVVEANATGIQVKGSLCEGVMVRYSDITGNTVGVEAVDLTAGAPLDAKYNWWGNASGPYNATTNPSGSGDAVSGAYVSYSPWLYKSQSECVTTSYPAASRSLSVGWNTLSVPAKLITTADAINELVPSGISAGYYFDGIWKELNPSSVLFPCDAIYIKMTSAKTVLFQIDGAATYVPTKELALGWNLIGLANVSSLPVNAAVASVSGSYAQVVSPSMNSHEWVWIAGQVDTPPPMLVGEGYWIFITKTPATLGGFTICPIVPKY